MPSSSEIRLAAALPMVRGMVNGFTRALLFRYRLTKPSSSVVCPPTQDPVTIAVRSRSSAVHSIPASRTASLAATTPSWAKRSSRPASLSSKYCEASKFFTSAAFWKRSRLRSTAWSGSIPDRPSTNACQNSPRLCPRADITPMPVTTTRRLILDLCGQPGIALRGFQKLGDSVDHVAH